MTIGEIAKEIGVSPKTVRYYEKKGLMREPRRNSSGYRQYEIQDVERLRFVVQARALELPILEIQRILAIWQDGVAPCRHVQELVQSRAAQIEARIQELRCLQKTLLALDKQFGEQNIANEKADCVCEVLGARHFDKTGRP